ncbi:hypothetical protein NKJ46_11370 [Mesorhizobium sp. M0166]|uniref:hypothetical protein n=1 Tax=Mesorhizobium sp. M0166 TaxID=2956902 RepID=UPI00333B0380
MAGLMLCPLALFVMTFAIARGVPVVGIVFVPNMMVFVAVTLTCLLDLSLHFPAIEAVV